MTVGFRRVRLIPLFLALLVPAAECQSPESLWRFVPPDTKALISIDWQRIRQSPAMATLRQKLMAAPAARSIPGLDLLDDVDRILIASSGMPHAAGETPDAGAKETADAPVIIAFRGHFEVSKVRQFLSQLGARPQAYKTFQVYRPQGASTKQMAWVQFDSSTVLFGDAGSLFAALDRNQFAPQAPQPGSIMARAAAMESNYDFWVSVQSPDLVSSDQLAGLVHGSGWPTEMQGFEAGVSLRSGLAADLTVQFDSEADAKKMVAELLRTITAASRQKDAQPQMRDIAKKLTFASDGPYAKISLHLTAEDLQKSTEAYAAAYQKGVFAAEQNARRTAMPPPAPVPPQRNVIRIEGLDSGPIEIPYHQP